MAVLFKYNGLGGKIKISGASTGGFKARLGIDADAQSFFNRVTTAGGTLTATEQSAIITLVTSLKSANLWDKMKAIYPMVGSSASACSQNLKSSSYTATFSGGWVFSNLGVLGNGTNTFMNTGVIPSVDLLQNDTHLSVYSRTNSVGGLDIGCINTVRFYIIINLSNSTYISINYFSDTLVATVTDTRGFYQVSRTTPTLTKMYRNNVVHGTAADASTGINTIRPVYLGAYNENGSANYFTTREYAFASIGNGLSDAESFNYYTAVQAFQTTLNRQV